MLLPLNGGAERRPLRKAAATTALGTTQEANNNVSSGAALDLSSDSGRLISAQAAFDAGQYDDAARIARGPDNQSADLDFLAGLSLAKLQRWNDARAAFSTGHRRAPQDARFLVELAGVDYKLKNARAATRELRGARKLDPHDAYTLEFLGTLYFLDGNLEAALKYWNAIDKPRLRNVSVQPTPKLDESLLQPAIGFNAPQVLTGDALLGAEARLDNLGIFPHRRVELSPASGGNYNATLHLPERDLWGDTWWEGALSWFNGIALRYGLSGNLQSQSSGGERHVIAAMGFRETSRFRGSFHSAAARPQAPAATLF